MLEVLHHLIAMTLVSSAVMIVVWLMRRPVRAAFGASSAYRAWLLVPISMIAMLLPSAPDVGYDLMIDLRAGQVYALVERSLSTPLDARNAFDLPLWLIGAWAAGAAVSLVYFASLQRSFVKELGTLSESSETGALRAERSAGCPALLGVLRPRVVLPADFESRYSAREQALILAHETVHLERRDTLWNALLVLLRCVFWFNPLIHVAASFVRVDQELACDAAVIERHPASRRTYADAMLKTELADAALPVGCHWRSSHPFKERLEMLKIPLPGRGRRALGGGLFAIVAVAVGYAAWAAEPTPDQAPGALAAPTELRALGKGVLRLGPSGGMSIAASTVTQGENGAQILEGDVRIDITPPEGARHIVKVRRTPDGEQRVESDAQPRGMTVKAQKVVLTPTSDGGMTLEFENGTIQEH